MESDIKQRNESSSKAHFEDSNLLSDLGFNINSLNIPLYNSEDEITEEITKSPSLADINCSEESLKLYFNDATEKIMKILGGYCSPTSLSESSSDESNIKSALLYDTSSDDENKPIIFRYPKKSSKAASYNRSQKSDISQTDVKKKENVSAVKIKNVKKLQSQNLKQKSEQNSYYKKNDSALESSNDKGSKSRKTDNTDVWEDDLHLETLFGERFINVTPEQAYIPSKAYEVIVLHPVTDGRNARLPQSSYSSEYASSRDLLKDSHQDNSMHTLAHSDMVAHALLQDSSQMFDCNRNQVASTVSSIRGTVPTASVNPWSFSATNPLEEFALDNSISPLNKSQEEKLPLSEYSSHAGDAVSEDFSTMKSAHDPNTSLSGKVPVPLPGTWIPPPRLQYQTVGLSQNVPYNPFHNQQYAPFYQTLAPLHHTLAPRPVRLMQTFAKTHMQPHQMMPVNSGFGAAHLQNYPQYMHSYLANRAVFQPQPLPVINYASNYSAPYVHVQPQWVPRSPMTPVNYTSTVGNYRAPVPSLYPAQGLQQQEQPVVNSSSQANMPLPNFKY